MLNNKPAGVKCKALKHLEKGMTNKEVAAKYGVPQKTLSAFLINEHKLTTSLEKLFTSLLEKKAKKFQLVGSYLKKKP